MEHRSLPMCFDFLPDGRLVLVSNQERALLTLEGDGTLTPYADLSPLSSTAATTSWSTAAATPT